MQDGVVVLNKKDNSPSTPWIDEPWICIEFRIKHPSAENHGVDETVDSSMNVEPSNFWYFNFFVDVLRSLQQIVRKINE